MKPKIYTGGCLCGGVRFEAAGPAGKPHSCSCGMCRRHSGALTVAWVEFPADAVAWTGPAGAPATFRSSDWSSRAFCANCGGSIGAIDDEPVVAVMLGAFDDPADAELIPLSHSFSDGMPAWWHVEIKAGDAD